MAPHPDNEIISNAQTEKNTSSLTYTIKDSLFSIAPNTCTQYFWFQRAPLNYGRSAIVGLPLKIAINLPSEDLQGSSPEEPNQRNTLRYLNLDTKLTSILREHGPLEPHTLKSLKAFLHIQKNTVNSTWTFLSLHALNLCTQSSRSRKKIHAPSPLLLCKTFSLLCRSYGSRPNPSKSARKEWKVKQENC